jgi:hypothetical protein
MTRTGSCLSPFNGRRRQGSSPSPFSTASGSIHRTTAVRRFAAPAQAFAESYVDTGSHVFTIQMGVPMGGTAASIRPNVLVLADALVPKLR